MSIGITKLFYKFNNYNYDDDYIDIVKQYLKYKTFPIDYNEVQKQKMIRQYKDFIIDRNDIKYKPLNLIVVSKSKKEETLKKLYADPISGINSGIKSFYNKVRDKYLGITRTDIKQFLENQQYYLLTQKEKKPINRPILSKYPNHRWACDLVDMNYYEKENKGYKWILTIIDFFSKKVFAIATKNKQEETINEAIDKICNDNNTYPKILQSDNGGEFKNGLMKQWAINNNVKLVYTLSYTPTSNGLIENFNNILRKMIREGFIRNKNLNWIDHLNEYVENRNISRHSTTKYNPNQIWKPGTNEIIKVSKKKKEEIEQKDKILKNDNDKLIKVKFRLEQKAKKILDKESDIFEIDEPVRVLMSSLKSEVRKLVKASRGKFIVVKYSPDIYYIKEILKPKQRLKDFMNTRYLLKDKNDNVVQTELKLNNPNATRGPKIFFGSELQKVNKIEKPIITSGQADKLNKINSIEFKEMITEIENEKKRNNNKPKQKEKDMIEVIDRTNLKRNKTKYNVSENINDLK